MRLTWTVWWQSRRMRLIPVMLCSNTSMLINRNFSPARKLELVRSLWQAACADGQIHHHEEQLIRRLADLLHVSHAEFIRSKHWALESQEE